MALMGFDRLRVAQQVNPKVTHTTTDTVYKRILTRTKEVMMVKLLMLGKNGTLVRSKRNRVISTPYDQVVMPGVQEALEQYQDWVKVIVSNEGGVDAGHKSIESTYMELHYTMELTGIEDCYFCPSLSGYECRTIWSNGDEYKRGRHDINGTIAQSLGITSYRIPSGGMLKLAVNHWNPTEVLYVGDRQEDRDAAHSANVPFMSAADWWVK